MPKYKLDRGRLYDQRINIKRTLSKTFDKQFKKKRAEQQQKWRKNKQQQQQNIVSPVNFPPSPTPTMRKKGDLRKKEGQKRRRLNLTKIRNENEKLRKTVRQLTIENKRFKASQSKTPPRPSPSKLLLDSISSSAKKRAVLRLKDQKKHLERGSSLDLRRKFGINLSNQNLPKKTSSSHLQTQIEQFFNRDDISKPCPDKNITIGNHQILYRLNHLTVLHRQFELETKIDIDYDTFCRYVPDYVKKPDHNSWGTCLCVTCLNPQMKFEKLKQLIPKYSCVKKATDATPADISEIVKDQHELEHLKNNLLLLNEEKFNLTFSEWQKEKKPNCAAPVSTKVTLTLSIQDFLKKFIIEIDILTDHVKRMREQYRAAKMAKEEAKEEDNIATIQIDWSENYTLKQATEEKGAFYYEQHIGLQTGHVWLKLGEFSFGCLSDDTNHMAEAAWTGLLPLLEDLVGENHVTTINMISDSPVSQYRNKTIMYLMKNFAVEHNIKFKWIYLESGHGKGVADAVGAVLKRSFDNAVNFQPDESFRNALDLMNAVENYTEIKLFIYDKTNVDELKHSLPKLTAVKGTTTFHELIATTDGKLYEKTLSSDKEKVLKINF